jgi:hypothetical protein
VVGEEATGEPGVVQLFSAQEQFRKWASRTSVGEQVDRVLTTLEKEVLPQQANEAEIERMQTLALRRTRSNFRAFAKMLELEPNDENVIRLAMVDRTPLTPSIFDPIQLWDRRIEFEPPQGGPVDPRTAMLPVGSGWWPVLGWAGWDNRASSARVFGLNILCEHNWFGGRAAWLFGFNMLLNLYHLGFDRKVSSISSH